MPNDLLSQYESRLPVLDELRAALEQETREALSRLPHIDRIAFRTKTPARFLEKARDRKTDPPYTVPLAEIEDQVGGRIIVFFLSDITAVEKRLHGTFSKVEQKHHRPKRDQEFGYESRHVICIIPEHLKPNNWHSKPDMPATFELQIRTLFMHAYAEPEHDLSYTNSTELLPETRRELAWIAASAWGADQAFERVRKTHEGASDTKRKISK